jgi:hypothetical protein
VSFVERRREGTKALCRMVVIGTTYGEKATRKALDVALAVPGSRSIRLNPDECLTDVSPQTHHRRQPRPRVAMTGLSSNSRRRQHQDSLSVSLRIRSFALRASALHSPPSFHSPASPVPNAVQLARRSLPQATGCLIPYGRVCGARTFQPSC